MVIRSVASSSRLKPVDKKSRVEQKVHRVERETQRNRLLESKTSLSTFSLLGNLIASGSPKHTLDIPIDRKLPTHPDQHNHTRAHTLIAKYIPGGKRANHHDSWSET